MTYKTSMQFKKAVDKQERIAGALALIVEKMDQPKMVPSDDEDHGVSGEEVEGVLDASQESGQGEPMPPMSMEV